MGGAPASAGEPPLLPVGPRTRPVGPPMGCGWKPGVPASAICFTNKFQIFIKGTYLTTINVFSDKKSALFDEYLFNHN